MRCKKKNISGLVVFSEFILLVLVVAVFSSKVLGDDHNKPKKWKSGDFGILPTSLITVTNSVTVTGYPSATVTPVVSDIPEYVPATVMVTQAAVMPYQDVESSINIEHQSLQVVPVSQRSEVVTSETVVPVVTQTVVQTIRRKIQQIGRGEIIKQPVKITPTPTPTTTKKKDDFAVIKSDILMFYNATGGTLKVGMEEVGGKVLKTNETEMRRIEVAINTNLKKEGVDLGITPDNRFVVSKNGISAVVDYPILVSLETRKLSVKTPYGVREMVLYPDEALGDLLEVKAFEGVTSKVLGTQEILEGLAYEMEGEKQYKVFGYFPVKVKERVYVLMDSGEIVRNNQPLLTSVVKLLSIW